MTDGTRLEATPDVGHVLTDAEVERFAGVVVDDAAEAERRVAVMARALFETDARVRTFVQERAELWPRPHETMETARAMIERVIERGCRAELGRAREHRVLEIAWARNENGWRTEAEARAAAVVDVLRGWR